MKACSKCGETKPASEFYKDKRKRDGLYPACKVCHGVVTSAWKKAHPESARASARRAWERDPDLIRARQRLWRQQHPETARAYRVANREKRRQYLAEWVAANKEHALAYQRDYYAKNLEAGRAKCARRDALRRGAPVVETIDRAAIYERDRGICHICEKPVPRKSFTLDHLVPLSKGGEHTARNVRVAHKPCNSRRKDGRLPAQLLLVG